MPDLKKRITLFLNRTPPAEVAYVPNSLVEMLLATYAVEGRIDSEAATLLEICQTELDIAVAEKTGPARAYFAECADLVREVQKASAGS